MRIRSYAIGVLCLFLSAPAYAVTINVPVDFPTIQLAVNAASSGDVVLVAPGTYVENVNVTAFQNGVKIHSSGGAAVTTIDGSGAALPCVRFTNVGITSDLIGFTLSGGSSATGG